MITIRVLVANDQPLLRKALCALLSSEPDIAVVGEAATEDEIPEVVTTLQPHVLLLDLEMSDPLTSDTVRCIRESTPSIEVVVLSTHHDDSAMRQLVHLGVGGYVFKDDEPEMLVETIRRVGQHKLWLRSEVVAHTVKGSPRILAKGDDPNLTGREVELLALIKKGWDNKRIARELCLGVQTVRNYLHVLYGKIGVTSRPEAIVWANKHIHLGEE